MQRTDYLNSINLSNFTFGYADDFMLKNLLEYYMENFNHTNTDESELEDPSVLYMDNLNLHQYILLGNGLSLK